MFMSPSFSRNARQSALMPLRKIEEFYDPKEFLVAIHDAIKEHQQILISTGKTHGNINTDTICIGSRPGSSNLAACGFLIDSPTVNPMFQSVNILSKNVLGRQNTPRVDFLDDLESFYYVIAWVSMAYSAPGVRIHRSEYPFLLSCWAAEPCSRESALEKEAMLFGGGFATNSEGPGMVTQVYHTGDVFEALLENFHTTLKTQYIKKDEGPRENLTYKQIVAASNPVYESMLWDLNVAIRLLDRIHQQY